MLPFNREDTNAPEVEPLFNPVRREITLTERVMKQLEDLIVQGQLRPGARLPSERELAQQFGVSRTVVREATRALVARGLLEVQAGSGTLVSSPTSESVSQAISRYLLHTSSQQLDYRKIIEVRQVLETAIVELAAQRRTSADLQQLEQILAISEKAAEDDIETMAANDVAFHRALAKATHNEIFSLVLDSIVDFIITLRKTAYKAYGPEKRPYTYLVFHRQIFEQIQASDPQGARNAMIRHLRQAEESILWVLEELE